MEVSGKITLLVSQATALKHLYLCGWTSRRVCPVCCSLDIKSVIVKRCRNGRMCVCNRQR